MSVIGTFTPAKDGGWTGSIRTLTINMKVRLVPNDNRDNDNAPAFRVDQTEDGDGRPYIIVSGALSPELHAAAQRVLAEAKPPVAGENAERAIDPRNAWIMTSLLKDVIAYGTATRAQSLGRVRGGADGRDDLRAAGHGRRLYPDRARAHPTLLRGVRPLR